MSFGIYFVLEQVIERNGVVFDEVCDLCMQCVEDLLVRSDERRLGAISSCQVL